MSEHEHDEMVEWLDERIGGLIRYCQASERILAVMKANTVTCEMIGELVVSDRYMKPELAAAFTHLREANEALKRAHTFASARMHAEAERE